MPKDITERHEAAGEMYRPLQRTLVAEQPLANRLHVTGKEDAGEDRSENFEQFILNGPLLFAAEFMRMEICTTHFYVGTSLRFGQGEIKGPGNEIRLSHLQR